MTVDTVVVGGTLATAERTFEGAVAIDDGRIVAVGAEDALPDAERRIDASGKVVMPGLVDPHVHVHGGGPNWLGTYESETKAAALGGVTTCMDFAWQAGQRNFSETTLDADASVADVLANKRAAAEDALVDYAFHYVLTKETEETLDEVPEAIDHGVTSFKLFVAEFNTAVSYGFVERAFERIAAHDAVAMVHTEEPSVCAARTARLRAEGKGEPSWYPDSRPDYAEAMAVAAVGRLAAETGVNYYNVHTTSRKAVEELTRFRAAGASIRGETCTHYLALDDGVFEELGQFPVIAPPIRTPDDNDAMFEALAHGTLDVVATDHIRYRRAAKEADAWWDVPYGGNSIRESLPVFHDEAVVGRGYSYPFLVRALATEPARTFGLPQKGTLDPGTDADIVVFDPTATHTLTARDAPTDGPAFSIFEGREVTGRVDKTLVRGELVVDDGVVVGTPGHGAFLPCEHPDWDV